ncbi:MAG: hypothetical protein OXU22_09630 [Gammaproteobacteria bacterium]|nr:hypothetical protein [Gammaproteobacteria bacterium]
MEEMRALADVYMFSENHSVSPVLVGDDGALTTDPACPARAESLQNAIAEVADKEVPKSSSPTSITTMSAEPACSPGPRRLPPQLQCGV